MTFENTDPVEITLIGYRSYLMIASGGDVTLERKRENGTWVAVSGSPILDGEEVIVTTKSSGENLRATASAAGTELTYGALDQ
jgi:hypothetical protein